MENLIRVDLIENFIKENRMTKGDFAQKCGISRKTLNKVLKKERFPKLYVMLAIRDVLQISFDYLVGFEEYKKHSSDD